MSWPITTACSTRFRAYHDSGRRPIGAVKWIVLHDEEAPTARGAAEYFTSHASGGSAHLCVDKDECYRCLPNTSIPWGAASAPSIGANTHGFHIEQAGYARWTAAEWNDHLRELERAAYKTALHLHLFGLPAVFVTAVDLPGKRGVTTHAEVSAASRLLDPVNRARYSHHDPGEGWPRVEFMRLTAGFLAAL